MARPTVRRGICAVYYMNLAICGKVLYISTLIGQPETNRRVSLTD
jgi:hypothetical protein